MYRKCSIVFVLILIILLTCSAAVSAESVNVVKNGSFEEEFEYGLGEHWNGFNNGGLASYTYCDDTWNPVILDGEHSQLMELHTKAVGGSNPNRYMGIYQVVDVVPDSRYMFSFYGMVRSTEGSEIRSRWNYRIQVGFDYNGGTDPDAVTEWTQMDWPEHDSMHPGLMQSYAHGVTAATDELTIFIRLWKKFPTVGQEANINIDAVSLVGPRSWKSAFSESTTEDETTAEAGETLPKTGAGSVLPLVGLGLAAVALGITGRRLFSRAR